MFRKCVSLTLVVALLLSWVSPVGAQDQFFPATARFGRITRLYLGDTYQLSDEFFQVMAAGGALTMTLRTPAELLANNPFSFASRIEEIIASEFPNCLPETLELPETVADTMQAVEEARACVEEWRQKTIIFFDRAQLSVDHWISTATLQSTSLDQLVGKIAAPPIIIEIARRASEFLASAGAARDVGTAAAGTMGAGATTLIAFVSDIMGTAQLMYLRDVSIEMLLNLAISMIADQGFLAAVANYERLSLDYSGEGLEFEPVDVEPAEPCEISTDLENFARTQVGAGPNRNFFRFLPPGQWIRVIGSTTIDGVVWWEVDVQSTFPGAMANRLFVDAADVSERGNCSAGSVNEVENSPVIVPPPVEPVSAFIWADTNLVSSGHCTILHWELTSGDGVVYLNDEIVLPNGSQLVCPWETTRYTLHIVPRSGEPFDTHTAINVGIPPQEQAPEPGQPAQEYWRFWASPNRIQRGQCTTLSWDVGGIREVYYQGSGTVGQHSVRECPTTTSTYELRVERLNGQNEYLHVEVVVDDPQPVIDQNVAVYACIPPYSPDAEFLCENPGFVERIDCTVLDTPGTQGVEYQGPDGMMRTYIAIPNMFGQGFFIYSYEINACPQWDW